MPKEIKRNVPASDYTQEEKPWKLTRAQWLVYYWLLAHSNRNPVEKHYFIYDNKYKKVDIMRDCHIKAKSTMTLAFKKLEEVGAIKRSEFCGPSYQIFYSTPFTPIDVRILKLFLAYCDDDTENTKGRIFDAATAITLYAIFKRVLKYNEGEPIKFNITLLMTLLGKTKQHGDKKTVVSTIHMMRGWDLIEFDEAPYTNQMGVTCICYTLTAVNEMKNDISDYFNDDQELDSKHKPELWKRAASSVEDIGECD